MHLSRNNARTCILISLGLAVAVMACYGQVAGHDFVEYDDPEYIVNNNIVQRGLTLDNIQWAFTTGAVSNWHPLTWLSYMLDAELLDLNPGKMLLVNVLLHAINSVLVLLVFVRLTGSTWRSSMVSAVFALHPLHVESVAWVSERKDVLSALFGLLTVLAYSKYAFGKKLTWLVVSYILLGLGLLAKPMLVTLPFVLLLLDFWPLRRLSSNREINRAILEKLPMFALSAGACVITIVVQRQSGAIDVGESIPLADRLQHIPIAYATYLRQALWPADLAVFYPHPGAPKLLSLLTATLLLAAITIMAARAWRTRPHLITGWLWFAGMLVPVIGLVQVGEQAHADRYMYLPLIGLTVMVVWSIPELPRRLTAATAAASIVSTLLLAAMSYATWRQVQYWRNTETLFERAVAVTQDNHVALYGLGRWHLTHDDFEASEKHLRQAIDVKHRFFPQAITSLGLALAAQSKFEEAEHEFKRAIAIDPDYAEAHHSLGTMLARLGRLEESVQWLQNARTLTPDSFETNYNLARVLISLNRLAEAEQCVRDAARVRNDVPEIHRTFAEIAERQGKLDEALRHYERAFRLRPDDAQLQGEVQRLRQAAQQPGELPSR